MAIGPHHDAADRPLDHVSLAELANALAVSAERLGGADTEELMRETLGLYGGKRLTAGISSRLEAGISATTTTGAIVTAPHGYAARME